MIIFATAYPSNGAPPESWGDHDTNAWQVTLADEHGVQMSTPFFQGLGCKNPPTAKDVLECLCLDASGIDQARSFEEWADEYGLDTDSRMAFSSWEETTKQTNKLREFLGEFFDGIVYTDSELWEPVTMTGEHSAVRI